MKTGPKVKYDKDGFGNFQFQCDHTEDPGTVMETVHRELAAFGLEVVNHESDGDYFAFTIRKIRKPAVKKVKVHPLTAETLKQLGVALKMFGEYTFGDKGAHEVMHMEPLAEKYKALPADEAAKVLWEVYTSKEHKGYGNQLAGEIIGCLQEWEELFKQPQIDEIDW